MSRGLLLEDTLDLRQTDLDRFCVLSTWPWNGERSLSTVPWVWEVKGSFTQVKNPV